MYNNKRFLAIIPARSGSKGLKDKNIKVMNGKPMLSYSIEAAAVSGIFDNIVVSTDSEEYADIARQYGASIPFLRPEFLAADTTTTNDVLEYTLNRLKEMKQEYDYFVLLQPTSPLRKAEDIVESAKLLFSKEAYTIVSVCEVDHSPLYMNVLNESLSMEDFLSKDIKTRRQDLQQYYRLNGAIYISEVNYFLKCKNFYGDKCYAYIMDKKRSIDIDDEIDFLIADTIMKI
jgi:CMP-N-acetylneuraminic acid synthetase